MSKSMRWYQSPYSPPIPRTGGLYDLLDTQEKRSAILFIGLQKSMSYRCRLKKKENRVFGELAKMGFLDEQIHEKMATYSYNELSKAMILSSPNDWHGEWIASRENVQSVKEKLYGLTDKGKNTLLER